MSHNYSRLSEAVKHYEKGNLELSLGLLDKLVSEEPSFADTYGIRGVVLTALGLYEDAIESFAQCRKVCPDLWTTDWYESFTLRLLGRNDEADATKGRAIATRTAKYSV